ncbi:MAG: hypothetical protein ACI4Q3_00170 [Kiritimatiellia bacterium]
MKHRLILRVLSAASASLSAGVLGPALKLPEVAESAMAVCTEGDRLYFAAGGSLFAYDTSQALRPTFLGKLDGFDNHRQIVAQGGFVYVVSRETGMRIVDARDAANMRIRARFDTVEFATGLDVVGDVAFVSERINGVECVDVSDPDRPAHICIRKTCESQSCRYRDGWLYSGEWGSGTVTVFDARDMRNFRPVGELRLHGFGDGVEIDGNYLYCSTGHDAKHTGLSREEGLGRGRGMDIFELTDPAKPRHVGRVDFPRFTPRNEDFWTPRVANGLAFCCDSHNGLFVVDVKDPARPAVVDRFCVPQQGKDWPSGAISSVAIGSGCIYVTSFPGGAFAIPVAGLVPPPRPRGVLPRHADCRARYPTDAARFHVFRPAGSGQARTVVLNGDFAYAAFGDAGLHVLRIKAEGGFEKVGELPGRQVYDCAFVGTRLLTAEGLDGFALYDLAAPAAFREVRRLPRLSPKSSVAFWVWPIDARRAVLSGRNSGYMFVDVDRMEKGAWLFTAFGTCQWDRYCVDRPVGGLYPLMVPYRGVRWIDVAPEKPRQIEFVQGAEDAVGGQCNGICAFGPDRFLMTVGRGYCLAGADRKWTAVKPLPFVSGLTRGGMYFGGIPRSDGRFVALTGRSSRRLAVFDFADADNPVLSRAYELSGTPEPAAFHRGKVIVPCGHQGLLMER